MYQYATTDIRTKISKNFQNVSEKQLHQFINIIGKCRNVCAHGERLFSFRINETIPDTLLHQKLQINQNNNHYVYGKQDLFAVVIALRYLINNDEFRLFKTALSKLIKTVIKQCPHLTEKQLLDNMDFLLAGIKSADTGKYNSISNMSLLTYTSCNVNVHMVALRKLAMPVAGGVPCVGSTFLFSTKVP